MPIRDFQDSRGVAWRVWDVRPTQPQLIERRSRSRRFKTTAPALERRTLLDRRERPSNALLAGWLVFRSTEERRRLFLVPNDWDNASERDLEAWLNEARQAPARLHGLDGIED